MASWRKIEARQTLAGFERTARTHPLSLDPRAFADAATVREPSSAPVTHDNNPGRSPRIASVP